MRQLLLQPTFSSSPRRASALGALALFAWAAVAQPSLHLATHAGHDVPEHERSAAEVLLVEAFRDPRTGRVDLARLAAALGHSSGTHEAAHAHGRTHEHRPESQPRESSGLPLDHGRGELAHLDLVFAPTPPVLPRLASPAGDYLPALHLSTQTTDPRTHLLAKQRGQAPPVVA